MSVSPASAMLLFLVLICGPRRLVVYRGNLGRISAEPQ
jgi:hypothetical protein